jgi:shikimate kinase
VTTAPPRHLVLIGLMAAGKSTVGRELAKRLGRPFIDNDTILEQQTGRRASEIEVKSGLDVLHADEVHALLTELDRTQPAVVAAAAAAAAAPEVRKRLREHDVVYLRATPETLVRRLRASDDGHRPFAHQDALTVLREQFAARDELYREVADLVLDVDGLDAPTIAERVLAALHEAQLGDEERSGR